MGTGRRVLLLYTDGLTETHGEQGERFEVERVAETLAASASGSAIGIVRSLQNAVEAWGTPTDDLTIVVCQRRSG
jgi:serine phosphatase RsbU (regulator of sigma subunit)